MKNLTEPELNELMRRLEDKDCSEGVVYCTSVHISNSCIEEWKSTGKFAHIRNELRQYQNTSFACLKDPEGCTYKFFPDNLQAFKRIKNFFIKVFEGKYVSISTVPNDINIESKYDTEITYKGSFNACPLFM